MRDIVNDALGRASWVASNSAGSNTRADQSQTYRVWAIPRRRVGRTVLKITTDWVSSYTCQEMFEAS